LNFKCPTFLIKVCAPGQIVQSCVFNCLPPGDYSDFVILKQAGGTTFLCASTAAASQIFMEQPRHHKVVQLLNKQNLLPTLLNFLLPLEKLAECLKSLRQPPQHYYIYVHIEAAAF